MSNNNNGSDSLAVEVDLDDRLVQKVIRTSQFKKCKRCGKTKETVKDFVPHKRTSDGYYHICRECSGDAISTGFDKSRTRKVLVQGPAAIEALQTLTPLQQANAIATLALPKPETIAPPPEPKAELLTRSKKVNGSLFTIMQMIVEELGAEDRARLIRLLAAYEEPDHA